MYPFSQEAERNAIKPTKMALEEITGLMKSKDKGDIDIVTRAYHFAKEAHGEQTRYSGNPYFHHVFETGKYLAGIGMSAHMIAAGLLHDSIEDAGADPQRIEAEFGHDVAFLVEGVTKLGTVRYYGLQRHIESLRKLFAATSRDVRVIIVKLMDRLHNARTLQFVPAHKRRRIALETLEVYAPIADRLGAGILKKALEDAAFPFAYPKSYKKVREVLKERKAETEARLEKTEKALKRELASAGLTSFRTESRVKGIYSLYKKLQRKSWDITKIHDILALRVVVGNVSDCYTVLGVVHGQWRPVPGKIKDYIAFEKPNGYRSIHTTIYTGDGGTLEIQIRTENMHREAQYGIASHFSYKELVGHTSGRKGGSMEWVRQFIPSIRSTSTAKKPVELPAAKQYDSAEVPIWIKELAEAHQSLAETEADGDESLADLKGDFFGHRVFVFTPESDVIDLPVNATPIDFAYAIHSDIGNHMWGAKVNGKMASIDMSLKNGDIVEIITRDSSKPSPKWLEHARTTLAKRHIRAALSAQGIDTVSRQ